MDTHKDTHTAAVLDSAGRMLDHAQFQASAAGYAALLAWLRSFGTLLLVGIEGTGAYGAGLAFALHQAGVAMVEVDRPDRKTRRRRGKSDPIDAETAARAALSGRCRGVPKQRDGQVEALRMLRIARRSAVAMRADTIRQVKDLIVTAPDAVRAKLRALKTAKLVATCANTRPDRAAVADPSVAVVIALRSLTRRHQQLSAEIKDLEALIEPLVDQINPGLCQLFGVGPDTAGQLLVTAGDNPTRLRSEASFAMLCGVAPLPASSGRTDRHRLNRGGDRQANAAIYRICITRLRRDPATRAYLERRTTTQRLTKKDVIRCLKRYIAREIHTALTSTNTHQPAT